jgi:deoxyribonuclease-4
MPPTKSPTTPKRAADSTARPGPLFGSHLSVAGGMERALLAAEALGMDCVQVFTKNQQQWAARALEESAIQTWAAERDRLGWQQRTVSHASYLINLASPDDTLWEKSVALMRVEIDRCAAMGIPFLVHHPGAYTGSDAASGIARIAEAYRVLLATPSPAGTAVVCLLENTVGSGTNLGRTFEELAAIRAAILDACGARAGERVGYCFDTCHAHAGGYDLSERAAADGVLDGFDRVCGLANLRVVHLNDSVKPCGSRADRHAHIGEGTIGAPGGKPPKGGLASTGFAAVVNRRELACVPMILETPKGTNAEGRDLDALNLARLRGLVGC